MNWPALRQPASWITRPREKGANLSTFLTAASWGCEIPTTESLASVGSWSFLAASVPQKCGQVLYPQRVIALCGLGKFYRSARTGASSDRAQIRLNQIRVNQIRVMVRSQIPLPRLRVSSRVPTGLQSTSPKWIESRLTVIM